MAISITDPPELPNVSDPSTFNDKAIALFSWMTGSFIADLEGITSEDIANEGRFMGVQRFTHTSGAATYTPTAGTKYAIVEMQAAGGGGGNGNSNGSGQVGAGSGGGAGNTIQVLLDVSAIGTATITHGAAGGGGSSSGASGGTASDSSYTDGSTSFWVRGGAGGSGDENHTGPAIAAASLAPSANFVTAGANHVTTIKQLIGSLGEGGMCLGAQACRGGAGGDSLWGRGGRMTYRNSDGTSVGQTGSWYGGGGSGGASMGSQLNGANGGDGRPAFTIIYEFTA